MVHDRSSFVRWFVLHSFILSVLLAGLPALGQAPVKVPYKIEFDAARDVTLRDRDRGGKEGLFVDVRFTIVLDEARFDPRDRGYKVVIEEDGHRVRELDVPKPTPAQDLTLVLAMDTSGSMKEHGRMDQARAAADVFLERLPTTSTCGLILFDHEIRPPVLEPMLERGPLRERIRSVAPRGGTAFLDAAQKGIELLSRVSPQREKALVLLTDGIDLNSKATKEAIIHQAKEKRVKIFTIGLGEPGKLEQVATALVLDHSGSMTPPAAEGDTLSKIEALHRAATRFVSIMPSSGRCTLVPFSTAVAVPGEFSGEKFLLSNRIKNLAPFGETALYDAVYTGIATLEAGAPQSKRAVVAMTDGIDNSSRRRMEEVVARAREAKVPLHMLGFGRPGELDEAAMRSMADQTGGAYYPVRDEKGLLEIFESLSIKLHDDGIDEKMLTELAVATGGQYYPAKDVGDLRFILERVSRSMLRKGYEVTFPSLRQARDGTARRIGLKLVRLTGEVVSNEADGTYKVTFMEETVGKTETAGYQVTGVVVAEVNYLIYLFLLAVLLVLIALPGWLGRRRAGGI